MLRAMEMRRMRYSILYVEHTGLVVVPIPADAELGHYRSCARQSMDTPSLLSKYVRVSSIEPGISGICPAMSIGQMLQKVLYMTNRSASVDTQDKDRSLVRLELVATRF